MSHSLHRYGHEESLQNDYTFYIRTSRGVNREGCGPKLRQAFKIVLSERPTNFGHTRAGSFASGLGPEEFVKTLDNAVGVQCVFSNKEKIKSVLKKVKEADMGISVIVSGLIDDIVQMAKEVGLKPHTAFLSLGIHGNKSLLAEEKVLEITTMCGHGMVSAKLAKKVIENVKNGKMNIKEGAHLVAKQCLCGIFNTDRCEAILMRSISMYDR